MDKKDKWKISASSLSHLKDPAYQETLKKRQITPKKRFLARLTAPKSTKQNPPSPNRKQKSPPKQSVRTQKSTPKQKIIKTPKAPKPLSPFWQKYYWLGVFLLPAFLMVGLIGLGFLLGALITGNLWSLIKSLVVVGVCVAGLRFFGRTQG